MDSTSLTPRSDPDQSAAPRIIVVLETGVSLAVHSACADLAAGLADRTRMPVTLASIPACCLDALRPTLGRARESRIRDYAPAPPPAPMSSAPFLLRADGRPDWGAMWGSFCELALYGGPPHRGPDNPLRAPQTFGASAVTNETNLDEMRRGIWETTGLYAEPTGDGWLAVTCESRAMAAWLCATIILENVEARVEEDRLLVPAGPDYRLEDEVKSIITVLAKTNHYWQAHITGEDRAAGDGVG
jgi:sirohydrochlorin cobaltochelatase